MNNAEHDLLTRIVSEYEIGRLAGFERLKLGYVNTSYVITTGDEDAPHKHLLRIYRHGIQEEELRFEHSIINHLVAQGFDLTAAVLQTRGGETFVRMPHKKRGDEFCAIFEFLPGEDRFSWVRPACNPVELACSGIALARFHEAVEGLVPAGRRIEAKIIELLPTIEGNIQRRLEKRRENPFERCLYDYRGSIFAALARLRRSIDLERFNQTPHLVIHGDYHPGNLKFDGGKVVGVFDLDWSKVDARSFDLGLALTYFSASWDLKQPDSYFRLESAATFLKAYQAAARKPLTGEEIAFLPLMCAAGNIYVLEWALRDFYSHAVNPQEYLGYLQHHLCLIHWYEDETHQRQLEQMIAEATCPDGHAGKAADGAAHTISGRATS